MFIALLFLSTLTFTTVAYDFRPRSGSIVNSYTVSPGKPKIRNAFQLTQIFPERSPVYYYIAQSQLIDHKPNNSYYINAFIHGSNNHEYLVISHAISNQTTSEVTIPGFFRAPILDITTGFYTSCYAISDDSISAIHTSSTNGSFGYDFNIQAKSPVLYNFAAGVFQFGTGLQYEWGIPSNSIQGVQSQSVVPRLRSTLNGHLRGMIGGGVQFEMHLGHTGIKASAWQIDNASPYQKYRSATLLKPNGAHEVTAVEFTAKYERTYVSASSSVTYPLDWKLRWPNGDRILSIYADQALIGSALPFNAYEGFSTLNGTIGVQHFQGYGIEMVRFVGK